MAIVVSAAGCTTDSPDRSPATTGPDYPTPSGPVRIQAEPVPDCAEVVSLIPTAVSRDAGFEAGPTDPPASATPDGFITTCVIRGTSSADPRLRLFMQVRIERPAVDPYRMTPLASWFSDAAEGFVGVNCQPALSWSGLDTGYRCETANGANVTLYLAGKTKGALVGLQVMASPLDGRTDVTVDAVRATATAGGEQVITALTNGL